MHKSILLITLGAVLALAASDAASQKLYRWTDKDGKVHYGDHVPPEAVERERETLNTQGMTVDRVDRAMTAEELAERDRLAAENALMAAAKEEQDKLDGVLLASYQTEGDLERSYAERFDLIEQSVESARVGIQSQQKSLADMLSHAADLERSGKPVAANVKQSILDRRKQVVDQREYLVKRQQEKASLEQEYAATVARYRELKGEAAGG